MLEHRGPFDPFLDPGGSTFIEESELRAAFSKAGFLLLQSAPGSALDDTLASELGIRLPAPQNASIRGGYALLWLTPAEWLLEHPANETDSLRTALTRRLATSLAVVTDMTDGYACCEVSGARAADVLMSGCSLDLRMDAFPANRVARTVLADAPAIIWNPGGAPLRLRCIVDRSLARHLRDWLQDQARMQQAESAR